MSRNLTRVRKLETVAEPERGPSVYSIPALTEGEFEEKRAALIEAGELRSSDVTIHVRSFTHLRPIKHADTVQGLFDYVAADGRKLHEASP
jgi:hypothetical protein